MDYRADMGLRILLVVYSFSSNLGLVRLGRLLYTAFQTSVWVRVSEGGEEEQRQFFLACMMAYVPIYFRFIGCLSKQYPFDSE